MPGGARRGVEESRPRPRGAYPQYVVYERLLYHRNEIN